MHAPSSPAPLTLQPYDPSCGALDVRPMAMHADGPPYGYAAPCGPYMHAANASNAAAHSSIYGADARAHANSNHIFWRPQWWEMGKEMG